MAHLIIVKLLTVEKSLKTVDHIVVVVTDDCHYHWKILLMYFGATKEENIILIIRRRMIIVIIEVFLTCLELWLACWWKKIRKKNYACVWLSITFQFLPHTLHHIDMCTFIYIYIYKKGEHWVSQSYFSFISGLIWLSRSIRHYECENNRQLKQNFFQQCMIQFETYSLSTSIYDAIR